MATIPSASAIAFALGLVTWRGTCGVALAFLRSAVRAEGLLEKFGDK
jgi:hypothetical protein